MEENNITVDKAVQTIKGAILRAQAQASQSSNAIQLSLYYGIGRYVSINLQQAHWGAIVAAAAEIARQFGTDFCDLGIFIIGKG